MANTKPLTFMRHLIDVVAIFYFFSEALLANLLPEYVFDRLAKEHGLNYSVTKTKSDCITPKSHNDTDGILQEVQRLAALFNIGSQLCKHVPGAIISLFLGPLSDIIGRKPILIWTNMWLVIGCVFLLVVDFLKLSIQFLYISLACFGMGGATFGLLMIVATYLSDLYRDEKSRTVRFGILEGAFLLSTSVSMYGGGVFVKDFGFRNSFFLITAIAIAGLLYSIFLKESYDKTQQEQQQQQITICTFLCLPIKLFKIFLSGRNNMWRIWLLAVCSNMLMFVAPAVLTSLLILTMLNKPLCFSTEQIGYFSGTFLLVAGIGTIFATKVLTKFMQDSAALVFTVISGLAMTVCFGFASSKTLLYIAIPIGCMSLGQSPLSKAIACSFVSRTEFGSVMALFSTLQSIFTTIGHFIFQPLYVHFNKRNNSSNVYFAIAAISFLPFVLMLANMLYDLCIRKKDTTLYLETE